MNVIEETTTENEKSGSIGRPSVTCFSEMMIGMEIMILESDESFDLELCN